MFFLVSIICIANPLGLYLEFRRKLPTSCCLCVPHLDAKVQSLPGQIIMATSHEFWAPKI